MMIVYCDCLPLVGYFPQRLPWRPSPKAVAPRSPLPRKCCLYAPADHYWGLGLARSPSHFIEQRLYPSFFGSDIWVKSEPNLIYLSKISFSSSLYWALHCTNPNMTPVRRWQCPAWSPSHCHIGFCTNPNMATVRLSSSVTFSLCHIGFCINPNMWDGDTVQLGHLLKCHIGLCTNTTMRRRQCPAWSPGPRCPSEAPSLVGRGAASSPPGLELKSDLKKLFFGFI